MVIYFQESPLAWILLIKLTKLPLKEVMTHCLAVVEDTISGKDGVIRAANIRTSTGKTNHPITKLYPLGDNYSRPN